MNTGEKDWDKKGWKDVPIAGLITEPGTARRYKTGEWRTHRPVWDPEKCINCLLCWIYCPDSAIQVKDGKVVGIDLEHCKGCGICAHECPSKVRAINMVLESEAEAEDGEKVKEETMREGEEGEKERKEERKGEGGNEK
ncbi:MAG TPA: 4Fe-4S binding protein [Firmicutes bacterium]|nr:4Fe-4S binding protein [Bacillota bacterium]